MKKTHRFIANAVESGNLCEVVRLCWRDIESPHRTSASQYSGRFCSDQVSCLARLLRYFDDEEGLGLLREKVRQRIRRDKHYQPPFTDHRDDLMARINYGIEDGALLQKIVSYVSTHPGVTRGELYEHFSVYADKKSKLQADKLKPPEQRSEEWISSRQCEAQFYLVQSIDGSSNTEFRVIRSEGVGLDERLSVYTFERISLRPSSAPSSQIRTRSYAPGRGCILMASSMLAVTVMLILVLAS